MTGHEILALTVGLIFVTVISLLGEYINSLVRKYRNMDTSVWIIIHVIIPGITGAILAHFFIK